MTNKNIGVSLLKNAVILSFSIAALWYKVPIISHLYIAFSIFIGICTLIVLFMPDGLIIVSKKTAMTYLTKGKLPAFVNFLLFCMFIFIPAITGNYLVCASWLLVFIVDVIIDQDVKMYYEQYKLEQESLKD